MAYANDSCQSSPLEPHCKNTQNKQLNKLTSSRVGIIFSRISPTVSISALILRMLHVTPTDDKAKHSHAEREGWGCHQGIPGGREEHFRSENSYQPSVVLVTENSQTPFYQLTPETNSAK